MLTPQQNRSRNPHSAATGIATAEAMLEETRERRCSTRKVQIEGHTLFLGLTLRGKDRWLLTIRKKRHPIPARLIERVVRQFTKHRYRPNQMNAGLWTAEWQEKP